jgi:hypothetical protein
MATTNHTRKLTVKQESLLSDVETFPGLTTAEFRRQALGGWQAGYHQAYESSLRDRLFRLEFRGLVHSEEKLSAAGRVVARRWFPREVSA